MDAKRTLSTLRYSLMPRPVCTEVLECSTNRKCPLRVTARGGRALLRRFPCRALQKIWSNNPLEPLTKQVKRRTNVVGIFPNEATVIRLVGSVLLEQHDE